MDSSKSTIIGFVLIVLVFIGWFYWMSSEQPKAPKQNPTAAVSPDTTHSMPDTAHATTPALPPAEAEAQAPRDTSGLFPVRNVTSVTKTIETPYFTAQVSSNGAAISSFVLKNYKTWDQKPVELINPDVHQGGDIDLKFAASDGKTVATNNLPFELDPKSVSVGANDTLTFSAIYRLDSNRSIEKVFHFTGAGYAIGIEYHLRGLENSIGGYHYTASLDDPLPYIERRTTDETSSAKAFAGQAGEMEDLNVTKQGQTEHKYVDGDISYAGTRIEYFEQAIIPVGIKTGRADISGYGAPLPDNNVEARYNASVNIPIGRTSVENLAFKFYLGPLEYSRVESLGVGLEQSMYFGWTFVVRPISIYILLPFFLWLHSFFANWGIVIIVFSLIIKLVTVPLSMGQLRSMKKMQVVQPMVTELRDKYKDDPKKMNEEMLKIYRTYGVNPAGGCLPLVLQMPILFALYQVLKNVIQLRQAPFALWIHDLSIPDALFHFGTKLPLIGEQISGLTLLLVVTMFVQQMFTPSAPQQKQMAYIMPIVFLFMFNNLPSGVALYYFTFNIIGIVQQFYLTKIATPPTLEEMKAAPKKGGGLMGRLQAMEQQQRQIRQQQYAGKGIPSKKNKPR